MPRIHIVVDGRVQGVGYRYFALNCAQGLQVTGWARNSPDGTVEIEAQAEGDVLETFVENLRRGPSFARVTDIDTRSIAEVESEDRFHIRY